MEESAPVLPTWLPAGEEPHPRGSITQCAILRYGGVSVVSLASGDIDAGREPSTGIYHRDTRHLSALSLTLGGVSPVLLDHSSSGTTHSAVFTNPSIRSSLRHEEIPAQALVVRRERVVSGGVCESITVSNYGHGPLTVPLQIAFDADFRDIFEVRGYERISERAAVTNEVGRDTVSWRYVGADHAIRASTLRFSPTPWRLSSTEARYEFKLAPGETGQLCFELTPGAQPARATVQSMTERIGREQAAWLARGTRMTTSHAGVNAMLERGLLDVHSLETDLGDQHYLAAGVPWFDTLFGRDSLIAGIELLAFSPSVLRNALAVLGAHQAHEFDPAHDAEPGKIPHELRWGELAQAGEVPFARYYGTADATPLYVFAAGEYFRWTGDAATIRRLWPNIEQAIGWCRSKYEADPHGFVTYARESAAGLENQGWKDSHDAIVWPDGSLAKAPIALVEVQAYVVAALRAFAELGQAIGVRAGDQPAREAERFARKFERAFRDKTLGYALCTDGEGRPIPTRASNAGHVLWARAADPRSAARVGRMLLSSDLFSGWGVRTLSTRVASYNPLGYHVGSVWPHDNAILLSGLRYYGRDKEAAILGSALVDMALGFPDFRVPELFSGDERPVRRVPTPYPVASRPQAWSAAAMPSIFTSMLGLYPGSGGQLSVVRPLLPPQVDWVNIRDLHFGDGVADLTFRRLGNAIGVEVGKLTGDIEVVLSDQYPQRRS